MVTGAPSAWLAQAVRRGRKSSIRGTMNQCSTAQPATAASSKAATASTVQRITMAKTRIKEELKSV